MISLRIVLHYSAVLLVFVAMTTGKKVLFTRLGKGKTTLQLPYKTSYVDEKQKCLGLCMYDDGSCRTFDYDDGRSFGQKFRCRFYRHVELFPSNFVAAENVELFSLNVVMKDCLDWYEMAGKTTSGIYNIHVNKKTLQVYCNMEVDGGGWVVFQRRFDGNLDFYRNWADYKNGFGNKSGEHWLGNEYIHLLTNTGQPHDILITGVSYSGEIQMSKYGDFYLENEANNYVIQYTSDRMNVPGYSMDFFGTPGGYGYSLGMAFSTYDRDNDKVSHSCTLENQVSGWWYKGCYYSNLNGNYGTNDVKGVIWFPWMGYSQSVKESSMMFRRRK